MDSKTVFRVASVQKPYTMLGNAMLQNEALSIECRGLLASILSRPADWGFNMAWIQRAHGIGRDKAYRLINEAIEGGYCRREQFKNSNGEWCPISYAFTDDPAIFEQQYQSSSNYRGPLPENQEAAKNEEISPLPENPHPENPLPVNQETLKRKDSYKLNKGQKKEGANSDKPNSARPSSSSASPKGKQAGRGRQKELSLTAEQQADEMRNAQAQVEVDRQRADEEAAFEAYVALADELGLPSASYLTAARRAAFRKIFTLAGRWPVDGGNYRNGELGLGGWLYALEKVRKSAFCQGKNDRGWQVSIDQLLTEKLIVKVVEGGFDARQPVEETAAYPSAAELAKVKPAAWEIRLGMWEKNQRAVWPTSWGPRPSEPGCGVPGDLLEKYGVNATAA